MSRAVLSWPQEEALLLASRDGLLIRYPGGLWAEPFAGQPARGASVQTLRSLAERGLLNISGMYEYRLTPAGQAEAAQIAARRRAS